MTKIYGASDDLIEVEGDIEAEHNEYDFDGTLGCSDGTKANIKYDENGEWKFQILQMGSKFLNLIKSVGDDREHTEELAKGLSSYSDVLILDDGIEWVKIDGQKYKA